MEATLALRHLAGRNFDIDLLAPAHALEHRPASVATPFGLGAPPPLDLHELARRYDVTLAEGERETSVPIRFIESRCDPHALAEIKQPTKFVAQIELDDGSVHPYIIYPERSLWTPMRLTADKACVALGKVEFVGEGSSD